MTMTIMVKVLVMMRRMLIINQTDPALPPPAPPPPLCTAGMILICPHLAPTMTMTLQQFHFDCRIYLLRHL